MNRTLLLLGLAILMLTLGPNDGRFQNTATPGAISMILTSRLHSWPKDDSLNYVEECKHMAYAHDDYKNPDIINLCLICAKHKNNETEC